MSSLLGQVKGDNGIEAVSKAFDAVRRQRIKELVKTSRELDFGSSDIENDIITKIKENLATRIDWIWSEDVQAEVQAASKTMRDAHQ